MRVAVFERGRVGGEASGAARALRRARREPRRDRGSAWDCAAASCRICSPRCTTRPVCASITGARGRSPPPSRPPTPWTGAAPGVSRRRGRGRRSGTGGAAADPGAWAPATACAPRRCAARRARRPVGLVRALAQAATAVAGCRLHEGEEVRSVVVERGVVCGIVTSARQVACSAAVNAMGAWAARPRTDAAAGRRCAARSRSSRRRGPLRHRADPARLRRAAARRARAARQHARAVDFRKRVTAGGLARILGAALELLPGLGGLPLVASWSGLRPGTADGRPIVGVDPAVRHYVIATGHDANGVLLAPLTAELVAGLLRGERSEWADALALTRDGVRVDPPLDGR
ncbi:MAG: FAD-dependent oxidoreductase [Candidatus Binatia bacterium]